MEENQLKKPIVNQKVFVLFRDELHEGEVFSVKEANKFLNDRYGLLYQFEVIIRNSVYLPPSTFCTGGIAKEFVINSSDFHFNPDGSHNKNSDWPGRHLCRTAFVFTSKEMYEKYISDLKKMKRNFHLQEAELYK